MIASFALGMVVATAGTAVGSHLITGADVKNGTIAWKDLSKGVRGKLASRGAAGLPGPAGNPGPPGSSSPRAYAYMRPICLTCAPGTNYTPLDAARSKNISLGKVAPEPRPGSWCFVLGGGIDPSTVTVVTSIVGDREPQIEHFDFETAEWVYPRDCQSPTEIEVRTIGYKVSEGGLVSNGSRELHFSLVVP